MENLSLSVQNLLQTVKRYVESAAHEELDAMLASYMAKELGKTQVICGPPPASLLRPDPRAPNAALPAIVRSSRSSCGSWLGATR